MRRSGPHPRPLYFYLNQPNPTGRCSPRWITLRPRSFHSRTSNRSITAIRIKCKCLRTSATRVLCKSTAPLVITEWKLMSSFVTNGPRKWTRTTIQERKEKETSKRDYLIKEEEEYNNASTSKLSKTDWLIDWLLYPTCSFENLIVSLKHLVKEGVKRGEEEHRIRGVALEGVLGFNSLTKLQKTHGCFYFSRVDLWFVGAAATIFIRLEPSRAIEEHRGSSPTRNWIPWFRASHEYFLFHPDSKKIQLWINRYLSVIESDEMMGRKRNWMKIYSKF